MGLHCVLHDEVVGSRIGEKLPALVDMPTLMAPTLCSAGENERLTMFWLNQIIDLEHPDQYAGAVVGLDA